MLRTKLFKNALWMLGGYGVRLSIQLLYFILIARALGPEQYGAFVGVMAFITLLGPFASWGSGNILVKHASRDPAEFRDYWGSAVAVTALGSTLLTVLALVITSVLFDSRTAFTIALPIAIGDLLGMRLADVAGQAFQSFQKLSRVSLIWVIFSSFRLGLALLFILTPLEKTASVWAGLYAASGLAAGLVAYALATKELGFGQWKLSPMRGEWVEGFYFSISTAAQGASKDLDKTLLALLAGNQVAGAYSAAYRMLEAGFSPIRALSYATYPRFFQEGARDVSHSFAYATRLLPWVLLITIILCIGLVVVAPFVPVILGSEFKPSAQILLYFLPLLFTRGAHYLSADALTGAGYQGLRSAIQILIAATNLGLNLWLIPLWGWLGAWASSIASDGLQALIMWIALYALARRKR